MTNNKKNDEEYSNINHNELKELSAKHKESFLADEIFATSVGVAAGAVIGTLTVSTAGILPSIALVAPAVTSAIGGVIGLLVEKRRESINKRINAQRRK